jgi:acetoin utilization deacetylase AcuC-like enzyme
MQTRLIYDPICLEHNGGRHHPERPERLGAILGAIEARWGVMKLITPVPAPVETLALCHDPVYITAVQRMSLRGGGQGDLDTVENEHTYDAALAAAGAAIQAVDLAVGGSPAFALGRPPGHHALSDRAMGFCFFNNVAIAAKYACERRGLERVAIVDFDVHHGNGTEDIVAGDERILMVGFYQHPFYPEGGARRLDPNLLNCPVPALTRGMDIRDLIDMLWLPRLDQHRPELILVSAGFDAHRDEEMADLKLNESDYLWITTQIRDVARRHARGRIVSCLEGGYSLPALARSAATHISVLAAVDLEALRANPARPSGRTC